MEVIATIVPIFAIIVIGWILKQRQFLSAQFLAPANKLVFFVSLPALIFSSIAKTKFHEQFDSVILAITILSATSIYLIAYIVARIGRYPAEQIGAFVQSSGHGNQGYIGLPIALYYLGEVGLAKAGIICGFLMILQNFLSVVFLQMHDTSQGKTPRIRAIVKKLASNPIIIAAMSGIIVSNLGLPIPKMIERLLTILGGLAPPTALLIIGASLSLELIRLYRNKTLIAAFLKLLLLPAIGLLFFHLFHFTPKEFLPALILLCSPTATIAYVMTKEMHGDTDLTVTAISASTLCSAITFIFWLAIAVELP